MGQVVAFTNQLPKDRFLFFYEFDNVEEFDVLEEANFISQVLEIDVDVDISSKDSYHLISYDILTKDECLRGQRLISLVVDHYLALDEIPLYRTTEISNRLRLGEKFSKPSPQFFRRFYHNRKHRKSLWHLRLAHFYYGTPYFGSRVKRVLLKGRICVYRTGIGVMQTARSPNSKLLRLEIKRLDRKPNQKTYKYDNTRFL